MKWPGLRKAGACDIMHVISISSRSGPMTLAHNFLKSVPIFEKCDEDTVQRMALGLRWHTYNKGDTILFQGMISHQMYLIASGKVAVFTRKDKETRQVATLR